MQHKREPTTVLPGDDTIAGASCADDTDVQAITVDAARHRILAKVAPLVETEKLAIYHSLNRILAADIVSSMNVPAHTNSAMDGFALAAEDLPSTHAREYRVAGTAYAGRPFAGCCEPGQCVRIMTGAVLPPGTDTVVMQEHTRELTPSKIRIAPGHRSFQNVRQSGEDISAGSTVLERGHCIRPADLGVMASIGIAETTVFRKPRVAYFSTGDELRPVGHRLQAGEIYDSNRYSLHGMLAQLAVETIDLGIVSDKPDALREAIGTAARSSDLIITTGGVSVGEADFVKTVVEELGHLHLWKIAMKPGRPIAFGRVRGAYFFGLPGNPVSVMTTFSQFVLPAIQRLSGQSAAQPLIFDVICRSPLRKRAGRFEYQRGVLFISETGELNVTVTGRQGSGILTSMSHANCLILLDERCDGVEEGDTVTVQPLATSL